ncbi:Solute binding protein, putative [Thermococcus sp. 4557]|nr:Solute binding protein, putative [Thermococcus sp. 4557]
MTVDDIKYYIAFYYTWAYKDTPDDPYYDSALSDTAATYQTFLGFQFTDNGYVVYGNYVHPFADDVTAGNYILYPSMPWEMYWAMGELVANSDAYDASSKYSFSSSGEGLLQLDLLTKQHVDDLAKVMLKISGLTWDEITSTTTTTPGETTTAPATTTETPSGGSNTTTYVVVGLVIIIIAAAAWYFTKKK